MKLLNVIFSFLSLDQDHSKRKADSPTLKKVKNKITKDPVKISIIFFNIDFMMFFLFKVCHKNQPSSRCILARMHLLFIYLLVLNEKDL